MQDTPHPREPKRVKQLENRINYWRAYLDDARTRINRQYDKRAASGKMTERQVEHWTAVRDRQLADVDKKERERLTPMEEEYRSLLGLDQ